FFFFQAEDGIRYRNVTGVQTCALPIFIDKGEIRLDDPVTHFFPGFGTHGKENIRLRHLLTHTSGLPAHRQYHKNKLNKEAIFDAINQEQLVAPVNSEVLYTDLG